MAPMSGWHAEEGAILLILFLWALGATWLIYRLGWLTSTSSARLPLVQTKELLIAVSLFFAFPLLASFLFLLFSWGSSSPSVDVYVAVNFLAILLTASLMLLCTYAAHPEILFNLFGSWHGIGKALVRGSGFWLMAFPLVQLVEYAIMLLLLAFGYVPTEEQVAVTGLRHTLGHPVAQSLALIQVIAVVPLLEELLFRGLFQTWLLRYFNPKIAILLSSAGFALLHFSWQQGATNFLLLPPLFLLGCFLGWSLERFQNLWVPIGLHATFNAVGALVIFSP